MRDSLKKIWDQQRAFSEMHYDVGEMDEDTREAKTRELALALHHEVSKLVSAVNFRGHRTKTTPADRDRILYEAVDAMRYGMAICNLWDFNEDDFMTAWEDKDNYLNEQHRIEQLKWCGQPVFIWDIDDVIAEFREGFSQWVRDVKGIPVDPSSREYFFIEQLAKTGYSSLGLYDEFIRERGIARLDASPAVQVLNELYDSGAWIHLVTARPKANLICKYDTYHWLRDAGVKFHKLDFTGEKLAFVSRTQYAIDGSVAACIDDGPNHVRSYLAHDFRCMMPAKPYNEAVKDDENLTRYNTHDELRRELFKLI